MKNKVSKKEKLKIVEKEKQIYDFFVPLGGINFTAKEYPKLIEKGNYYTQILYLYEIPETIEFGWFTQLKDLTSEFSSKFKFHFQYKPLTKKESKDLLINDHKDESTTESDTDLEATDLMASKYQKTRLYQEVESEEQTLTNLILRVHISNTNPKVLIEESNNFIKLTKEDLKFKFSHQVNNNTANFKSIFESIEENNSDSISGETPLIIPSKTVAFGTDLDGVSFFDSTGQFIGTSNNTPIFLDLNKVDEHSGRMSKSYLMLGSSGSGKSTTLKKFIRQNHSIGHKHWTVDFENEYIQLAEKLGGKNIEFNSNNSINILDIRSIYDTDNEIPTPEQFESDLNEHLNFVISVIKILNSDRFNDIEVAPFIEQQIKDLLKNYYLEKMKLTNYTYLKIDTNDFPIFTDILNYFNELSSTTEYNHVNYKINKHVQEILNDLVYGSSSSIFNQKTTIKIDNEQFVNFNLNNLFKSADLNIKKTVLYLILHYYQAELSKNRDFNQYIDKETALKKYVSKSQERVHTLLIDEFHLLTSEIDILKRVETIIRRARKYVCSLALATQELDDFLPKNASSELVDSIKTIFAQMNCVMIGKQKALDVERINQFFPRLSKEKLSSLNSFSTGQFLMLIGNEDLIVFIQESEENLAENSGG